MSTSHTRVVFASLSAFLAFAAAAPAEAGKFKNKGVTIVIGDTYPGYGYGYRSFGRSYGCGWLMERYEETGSTKWYKRWHRCKFGW